MAHLIFKDEENKTERVVPLQQDLLTFGRHPYCDIRLNDAKVSREHTRIEHTREGFFIEDMQSRNGTILNGKRLTHRVQLYNDDVINICDFRFEFHSDNPADQVDSGVSTNSGSGSFGSFGSKGLVFHDELNDQKLNITSSIKITPGQFSLDMPTEQDGLMRQCSVLKAKVHALSDFAKNMGKLLSANELFTTFLQKLLAIFPDAETTCLLVKNTTNSQFELVSWACQEQNNTDPIRVSRSILDVVTNTRAGILSDDMDHNTQFHSQETMIRYSVSSVMAVPVFKLSNEDLIGIVQVETTHRKNPFTHEDLDLLVSISNQLGVYYENILFHQGHMQEELMMHEMSMANRVQKGFLPNTAPELSNYSFYDYYAPARYLGGDFFDYIELPNGTVAVCLGDVSGKGVSAALLMAKLASEVRYSLLLESELPQVVYRLNNIFCLRHWENRFVTFIIGIIDPKKNTIRIVNAGHIFPIVSHLDGTIQELDNRGGFPLGIVPDTEYEDYYFHFEPGDSITFMSDGLSDAMNSEGKFFGTEGVKNLLVNNTRGDVKFLGKRLLDSVHAFAGKTSQTDDQCLVVFGRNANDI